MRVRQERVCGKILKEKLADVCWFRLGELSRFSFFPGNTFLRRAGEPPIVPRIATPKTANVKGRLRIDFAKNIGKRWESPKAVSWGGVNGPNTHLWQVGCLNDAQCEGQRDQW